LSIASEIEPAHTGVTVLLICAKPPMPRIEIISHPLCPHAQRLVYIALLKGYTPELDFAVTYLPYAQLRSLVPLHSPSGELPVLKLDGVLRTTNTNHAAEYLDGAGGLIPLDPELRLQVRERERRAGTLLETMRPMFAAATTQAVNTAVDQVFAQLALWDQDLASEGSTAQTLRMDMVALKPAFSLLMFFPLLAEHAHWRATPRLQNIAKQAVREPQLVAASCPNYAFEFDEFFKMTQSAFSAAMQLPRR
jgi:glutathione S-transferase